MLRVQTACALAETDNKVGLDLSDCSLKRQCTTRPGLFCYNRPGSGARLRERATGSMNLQVFAMSPMRVSLVALLLFSVAATNNELKSFTISYPSKEGEQNGSGFLQRSRMVAEGNGPSVKEGVQVPLTELIKRLDAMSIFCIYVMISLTLIMMHAPQRAGGG